MRIINRFIIKSKFIITKSGYSGLLIRLKNKCKRTLNELYGFFIDAFFSTYNYKSDQIKFLNNKIHYQNDSYSQSDLIPEAILLNYLSHRFDLLGSGWYHVHHNMECAGLRGYKFVKNSDIIIDSNGTWLKNRINRSNLIFSQKVWRLVEPSYKPIDWQIDFKSGYRWSEKTWSKNIIHSHKKGVDIKVPWELARMQHLPQISLKCLALPEESKQKVLIQNEFRNQILDFIATNPPRYGVNWVCAMDVAIRASNWLLAYNILNRSGVKFDDEFEHLFINSIVSHGRHIISNLEWVDGKRGNHYLANISGLVFISFFLASSKETDAWLSFSIKQLISEVSYQFYPDGTNFEGSTYYHRLSAEMVLFSTALLLGMSEDRKKKLKECNYDLIKIKNKSLVHQNKPLQMYKLLKNSKRHSIFTPFPVWYFKRVERIVEFIVDISKPNGSLPQIGDNDSGRFFKLKPEYQLKTVKEAKISFLNLSDYKKMSDDEIYFTEDYLNVNHLKVQGYALFNRNEFVDGIGGGERASKLPDFTVLNSFLGDYKINLEQMNYPNEKNNIYQNREAEAIFNKLIKDIETNSDGVLVYEFVNKQPNILDELTLKSYPDFGLYLYKSKNLYLSIRCWPGKKPFHTGHMHLDQLAIDLIINRKEIISDPGSYIYTPLPSHRWDYRSAEAHFSPFKSPRVQSFDIEDIFSSITPFPLKPIYFGSNGFLVKKIINNSESYYLVHLQEDKVKVYSSGFARKTLRPTKKLHKSVGYGVLIN